MTSIVQGLIIVITCVSMVVGCGPKRHVVGFEAVGVTVSLLTSVAAWWLVLPHRNVTLDMLGLGIAAAGLLVGAGLLYLDGRLSPAVIPADTAKARQRRIREYRAPRLNDGDW